MYTCLINYVLNLCYNLSLVQCIGFIEVEVH
jgi:hypothetical protein